jgi:hypothetical protein
MKNLKVLRLPMLVAMALSAVGATGASATTLEVGGVTQNASVSMTLSLTSGTSMVLSRTDASLMNTCTTSHAAGTTSVFTGSKMTGALSTLTFSNCTRQVTPHKPGQLYIEHDPGTTNGTVFSENGEWTWSSPFGTVNCQTGGGTDIGTLTGAAAGSPILHFNAVLNCGFLLPSATWKGSYTLTSPSGLGVSA